MNESEVPKVPPPASPLRQGAMLLKLAAVTVLVLLLLVPLRMIRSVLRERLDRRNAAVADITSSWGRDQRIIGPVLILPYRYSIKSWKEQPTSGGKSERVEVVEMALANAYFLPSTLAIQGTITPRKLRRGIYQAVVYSGKLECAAQFKRPDLASLRIEEKEVLWDEALIAFAIPDLRGVQETLQLKWGANNYPLLPGSKLKGFPSGVFARIPSLWESGAVIPVGLELTLNGSGGISFAPLGAQNTVKLSSPWPDPKFRGSFLPAERAITPDGFDASWQVSFYGRDYPQQWTDRDAATALDPTSAEASLFGVDFLPGIDGYRNVERAIKYGVLFLALVFTAFFLFEIVAALRIHPVQYALVGAALCLFYLGLLSLSEFIRFGLAYLAAFAAATLLICGYSVKMLKSGKRTFLIAGLLAAIYGFLYVALQLQDYSLLFGTAGLFTMLAIVIYVTRNVEWYAHDQT